MRTAQLSYLISASVVAVGALILAGSPGCKKAPPPPPPLAAQGSGGSPGGAAMESAGQAANARGQRGLRGEIVETMDSGGYTYLKLRTSKGEVWAAVRKATVAKGQKVTLVDAHPMKNFKSRTLKRTFPVIYFGRLGRPGQAAAEGNPHARGMGSGAMGKMAHPKRTGGKRVTFDKPLAKAAGTNGRTVAELYAQSKDLAGKTILLHAKVVKFTKNIMGKNWVHVQDGTGKVGDFDLTVTTQATVKVGDVVLVEGTVKADVNLGSGYRYRVLVEKATFKPAK
jgi:hypothetical protein